MNWLYVLIGGGIGAYGRYALSLAIHKPGNGFPLSTFLINITGCLFIGLVSGLAFKFKWSEAYVLFFMTGILGGFTTFSSFGMEFYQLMKNNQTLLAFIYLGLSNFVGIGLCALGYYLAK